MYWVIYQIINVLVVQNSLSVCSYNNNRILELLHCTASFMLVPKEMEEPTIQYTRPAFIFYSPCRYNIHTWLQLQKQKMLQFPRGWWWVRGSVGCTLACDLLGQLSPRSQHGAVNNMDSGRSCSTSTWSPCTVRPPPRIFQRTRETAWSRWWVYLLNPLEIVLHHPLQGASELAPRKALQALYRQSAFLLRELLGFPDPAAPVDELDRGRQGTRLTELGVNDLP